MRLPSWKKSRPLSGRLSSCTSMKPENCLRPSRNTRSGRGISLDLKAERARWNGGICAQKKTAWSSSRKTRTA